MNRTATLIILAFGLFGCGASHQGAPEEEGGSAGDNVFVRSNGGSPVEANGGSGGASIDVGGNGGSGSSNINVGGSVNNGGTGGSIDNGGAGGTGGDDIVVNVPDPICEAGTAICSGIDLDTCNADGSAWVTTACEFACTGGACTGECTPGAVRCNDLASEVCDADGQWQVQTVCPYECTGNGECTGTCTEEDTRCTEDGNVEMCVNSDWFLFETCDFVCSAGACAGSCETGTTQCAGKAFQTCTGGNEFVTTESCEFACDDATGCYGSCDPSEPPTCNGNTLEGCLDGEPAQYECPFVCQNGGCAGVCVPGDTRCGSGNVETCNAAGQWEVSEACTAGDNQTPSCDPINVVCQVQCQAGFDDCDGEPSNGCEADLSSEATCLACGNACGAGESCQATGCVLDPVCTPGAKQCAGNASQTCDAEGQWETTETCEFVCSGAGVCSGSCTPGETICNGDSSGVLTCSGAGAFESEASCYGMGCSEGACNYEFEVVQNDSGTSIDMIVDGSYLYWQSGGEIRRALKDGSAAYEVIGVNPGTGYSRLNIDSGRIVWSVAVGDASEVGLWSMPVDGSETPVRLTAYLPLHIDVRDGMVRWNDSTVNNPKYDIDMEVPGHHTKYYETSIEGGPVVEIWDRTEVHSPYFTVDGNKVYYARYLYNAPTFEYHTHIYEYDLVSNIPRILAAPDPAASPETFHKIVKSGDTLAIVTSAGLRVLDATLDSAEQDITVWDRYANRTVATGLHLDATHVYYPASGAIRRMALDGGSPFESLATPVDGRTLTADSSHVYFLSELSDMPRSLLRIAK